MTDPIFISHSTKDDPFVAELRRALELRGLTAWIDSCNLRSGDHLRPEIERAIREARAVLVVASESLLDSKRVYDEVKVALEVQAERGETYRAVPPLSSLITLSRFTL